ncbi:monooxygenase [Polyangium jinanense]|uniref:Copper type II ascorbate-dependent monooxygenase C-terminal domain-containing protein n=1 Tax=Polyangium jinanense TaxID=2829994 RepID=A0A9X3X846_9BACT|nr:hypothetical protein [Polyangium jinanense]MDC3959280.1 hypothetical protein [Polyangium jinanense]MDC3985689.1 hypothetical protein [Polyangium jinanense]
MTSTIAPGSESYGCRLFQVPPEGLVIRGQDVAFGPGGHHVLLYRTPYRAIPSQDEQGIAVDALTEHDCSEGATARWKVDAVVGGSESFGSVGMLHRLPDGVGVVLEPNVVLVMSTHYLNTTSAPLEVDARINMHTMPREELRIEAGLLYMDNHVLRVAPFGEASARMRCPVPEDVHVVSLQSHMHARGAAFEASLIAPSGTTTSIYSTTSWQEPPVRELDPPLLFPRGSTVEIRCDYKNSEARPVAYGLSSSDEMCQLIGPYFPKNARFERCEDESGATAATWVGSGKASGAETVHCLREAMTREKGVGYAYYDCVHAACSTLAAEVSAVVRCHEAKRAADCANRCQGGDAEDCVSCLAQACAAEEQAARHADSP